MDGLGYLLSTLSEPFRSMILKFPNLSACSIPIRICNPHLYRICQLTLYKDKKQHLLGIEVAADSHVRPHDRLSLPNMIDGLIIDPFVSESRTQYQVL